jgi:hypothetical protein
MPDYRKELAEILQRKENHNAEYAKRDDLANRIKNILPSCRESKPQDITSDRKLEAGRYNSEWLGLSKCNIQISSYPAGNEKRTRWEIDVEDHQLSLELARLIQRHIADKTYEHEKATKPDTPEERYQANVDFVLKEWDEEHMGEMPESDKDALRVFAEYYKSKGVPVPYNEEDYA